MRNKEIADIFSEMAQLIEIEDEPNARFKIRAYQKAALTISTLQEDVEDLYEKGGPKALMELPGIGQALAEKIVEYLKTGKIKKFEQMKKEYPVDFKNLTRVSGLGPKKAFRLYKELKVRDLEDLKNALEKHKIQGLEGFGTRSEEQFKKGLIMLEGQKGRILLGDGLPAAESIVGKLNKSGLVEEAMVAGSARRMRETVGDLDILVLSSKGEKVMDFFVKLPEVSDIVVRGPTKTTVMLRIGVTCDLRVIEPNSFGAAVQYFTGSKDHNVQVRTIAIGMGYKLNEYGLFDRKGKLVSARSEHDIYKKLGMEWMPPEMREARGEVKLAQQGKLPKLVELAEVKGDMHTHTVETDGANTIEEMVEEARRIGHKYIATTNHTKSLQIAKGMNEKGFERYFKKVDALNRRLDGKFRVFKGAEVDVLKDGSLDLDDKCLKSMDWVVASVHMNYNMEKDAMTKRIVKALDSGLVNVMGHPTGRELLVREQYAVDLDKVFEAAERNGVALEINANPQRMDLNDTNIMAASKYKVRFALGTDAHRTFHMRFMRYGVGTARRGWLGPDRIINTMELRKVEGLISR
ncbi:MAG: DNA polymerase/3'-5' exonuclease PolX [Candidatus Micrarchaeota archaeon]|nr:DNA polymerase/3'-5' exonuclease PolX [Candidatus Micrarchaeota archaeon]